MLASPIEKKLRRLIEMASILGIGTEDRRNAYQFLIHHEWGECLDTVLTQLYEYSIPIDHDFLTLARELQADMKIDRTEYSFVDELLQKGP
jgi:hypothetical protein